MEIYVLVCFNMSLKSFWGLGLIPLDLRRSSMYFAVGNGTAAGFYLEFYIFLGISPNTGREYLKVSDRYLHLDSFGISWVPIWPRWTPLGHSWGTPWVPLGDNFAPPGLKL